MDTNFQKGQFLSFDKPLHWTSFDVVEKVRDTIQEYITQSRIKVGHAGTLDPLATGLLILGVGRYTKKIPEIQGLPKEYTGTITLGATTPTCDRESEVDQEYPIDHITPEKIDKVRSQFLGMIQQKPPLYSAVKVEGERLYKKARRGEKNVKIPPREVEIMEFDILNVDLPEVEFRVRCGKGTYIRSLARDFGNALDSGGHLSDLRRTKIGEYDVENTWQVENFIRELKKISSSHEGA